MSITYSVCMFVALVIQHPVRMRHSHLWPQVASKRNPKYLIQNALKRAISASFRFSYPASSAHAS